MLTWIKFQLLFNIHHLDYRTIIKSFQHLPVNAGKSSQTKLSQETIKHMHTETHKYTYYWIYGRF